MKKIMFNDTYGLTQAVLDGRKTQTRRIIADQDMIKRDLKLLESGTCPVSKQDYLHTFVQLKSRYKVGDIVAIAQSYMGCGYSREVPFVNDAAWTNKLYVKAEYMPHHIQITRMRISRLCDIGFYDCFKESIVEIKNRATTRYNYSGSKHPDFITPWHAFANLIDNVAGSGTWDSNPFVFVYDFKLID